MLHLPLTQATTPKGGGSLKKCYLTPFSLVSVWFSVCCLLLGLIHFFNSSTQEYWLQALCFDYVSITEQKEYWRLLTGHIVHSSFNHLFWDLLAFSFASIYVERKNRAIYIVTTLFSITCLNLYLLSPLTDVAQYSGLSGVLYSVITVAAWQWQRDNKGLLGWAPLLIIVMKTLLEIVRNDAVFVSEGWDLFAESHLIGLITGIMIMMALTCRKIIYSAILLLTIQGCSIAAYTPVVGYAVTGSGDETLRNDAIFNQYINVPLKLTNSDKKWFLKKFNKGRYTIEVVNENEHKELICDLSKPDASMIISDIYNDAIHGQRMYQASVMCDSKTYLNIMLNVWSVDLEESLLLGNQKSSP